ncbi:glycosyltransferase family 4 protein [Lactobacillus murinus]|uniref:Glycosyltransferase family 4 protein n=2 Tax=Ligilactobacillus murinus TaxID=1622 RepID=A0AAE7BPM9_9LACO|nr:glycosyltransferase [Ligilactobacillus murinus]NEF83498.1 glycosyltransferase family 4 protein [Ligilactobacillus murinus]NEF85701.1 glycosyltransferase family 4 protein [Ligilactobacillus murinus]NEF88061.1 glycosyltransferase family 4 protein [Ligilactobacillus murinus]NEF90371.1 glycosyltransferase family 4 protein [Ligilactobacillus murinus]NEF92617.1 glycosyltransferase family 4 protein [Ligilactobacillus murinus]
MKIACSKSEYDASRELTSKTEYVNNGINMKKMDKLLTNGSVVKSKKLRIVTLGRTADKKTKVFTKIATALPNDKFVWIDDGNMRDSLTDNNITITGWLDRKLAIKEMENSDGFLLTSHYEGRPMSLLETMYIEKVCVVSSVIGNRDVINGRNGFLCKNIDEYIVA